MPGIAMIFGVLLSILGGVLFGLSDPEHRSVTALIPTFFGVPLILLGVVARQEKLRMHAMHGAALLALIGLFVPAYRALRGLVNGTGFTLAISGQIIMALLCAAFLFLCIQSFIAARRARQVRQGERVRVSPLIPRAPLGGAKRVPLNNPMQRLPRAASASTRRVTAGSSTSGGAWCGLMRASMIREPVQPQCFSTTVAPMPSMSAAGLERVNVTHRKLLSEWAAKSLSLTSTMSGNALMESWVV